MKKTVLILIFMIVSTAMTTAQSTDKIKGDRNVTIKQTYIDDFDTIVVDGAYLLL